jgi:hypothetical protein
MRDIDLIQKPTEKLLEIEVHLVHSFDAMSMIDFQLFEGKSVLGSGNLTIKSS